MTCYFQAAEKCGLRRVFPIAPKECISEARVAVCETALREVEDEVTKAPSPKKHLIIVVPKDQLPLSESRAQHIEGMHQRELALRQLETKDLSDYQQRDKVRRMQDEELRALLDQEVEMEKAEVEQQLQEKHRQKKDDKHRRDNLRSKYGECFLWKHHGKQRAKKQQEAWAGSRTNTTIGDEEGEGDSSIAANMDGQESSSDDEASIPDWSRNGVERNVERTVMVEQQSMLKHLGISNEKLF